MKRPRLFCSSLFRLNLCLNTPLLAGWSLPFFEYFFSLCSLPLQAARKRGGEEPNKTTTKNRKHLIAFFTSLGRHCLASILLRAIHLIALFLGTTLTINHLPRNSTPSAKLADALTRSSTTGENQLSAISKATALPVPDELLAWLAHPEEDWLLAERLLHCVIHRL
jgi:hypothetical protein